MRGCHKELRRIADGIELLQPTKGVGFRSFYGDTTGKGVDDASLMMQSEAEFAAFERREAARARRGPPVTLDEALDDDDG